MFPAPRPGRRLHHHRAQALGGGGGSFRVFLPPKFPHQSITNLFQNLPPQDHEE
jgi:hypothetical protein